MTEDELAALDVVSPTAAAKVRAEQSVMDEDDDEDFKIEFMPPPVLVNENGERPRDSMVPAGVCPACERGAPRRGAEHNCGKPTPGFMPRREYG